MQEVTLRMAVISADPAFRAAVAEVLRAHPELAAVVADQAVPAASLTAEAIDRLQAETPEVVLVDLNGDPAAGMRMVRLMGDAAPARSLTRGSRSGTSGGARNRSSGCERGIFVSISSPKAKRCTWTISCTAILSRISCCATSCRSRNSSWWNSTRSSGSTWKA